jgi:hypothetical protein
VVSEVTNGELHIAVPSTEAERGLMSRIRQLPSGMAPQQQPMDGAGFDYDPVADSYNSWLDAIAELRKRHLREREVATIEIPEITK